MLLIGCRAVLILMLAGLPSATAAADRLAGPYLGSVERIVDGDTLAVRVTVWLAQDLRVLVRLRGVDAPEIRGRCNGEKLRAVAAAQELKRLVSAGPVVLTNIEGDNYYGRVVADVVSQDGADIGKSLVKGGFAREYDGGGRSPWCAISWDDRGAVEEMAQATPTD